MAETKAPTREEIKTEIAGLLAELSSDTETLSAGAAMLSERTKDLLSSILTLVDTGLMPPEEADASARKVVQRHLHLMIEENERLRERHSLLRKEFDARQSEAKV